MTDDAMLVSTLTFSQSQTLCEIHPLVPATILHYYVRRSDNMIAGMLLGVREGNKVSVRNCYPVLLRFTEDKDLSEADQRVLEVDYVRL
jgi:hypothetical protein